jgi:hypothetical protein
MKLIALCLTLAGVACAAKLTLKDLPAAVQKTVQENLNGGEIKAISKEAEKGVTQYEFESMLNGRHRDFNVDTKGGLVVMEEETAIDSIPAAAKAGIIKKVADGKLGMVESLTRPGKETLYEAAFTTKGGKKSSVLVKADGTPTKE